MRQTVILAFVVASAASAAPAANSGRSDVQPPLTLERAIAVALAQNPSLRAAAGRTQAATARAAQDRLWSNPELEVAAEDWPWKQSFSDAKQTIGLAQTFPFPGKKRLDGQIGAVGAEAQRASSAWAQAALIRGVKIAFYQTLAAEQLVTNASALVQVAESSAQTARRRTEAGAASVQEQLRAEIQFEQAKSDLLGYQDRLDQARQSLATLMGRPSLETEQLSGSLPLRSAPRWLETGLEDWLSTHPRLIEADRVHKRAELAARRARLEPYPDLRVGVAAGRIGETDEGIVEFRFVLPLPLIDRSKGSKRAAESDQLVAAAELEALRQSLTGQWETLTRRFRSATERATVYREQIMPKAEEALALVEIGFREGKYGFIDLLDTQRTASQTQLAYQERLLEVRVAQADLEALLAGAAAEYTPISATTDD